METVGAANIFEQSVQKHGFYYTSFYGDGDSKSFSDVERVYGSSKPVTKYTKNGSGTDYANYEKKRNLVEQNDWLVQE